MLRDRTKMLRGQNTFVTPNYGLHGRSGRLVGFAAGLIALACAANGPAAWAQGRQIGQVARSAVGSAGQRQTPKQVTSQISPLAAVPSRLSNRVQSRLRNRIDRYYDPQANATSPFVVAADQARTAIRRGR